jgi:hypothetical protein
MSPADATPMIESSIFRLWQFQFLKQNGNLAQRVVGDLASMSKWILENVGSQEKLPPCP